MKSYVCIYARKSRLKNDDEEEISRQIDSLVSYAKKNNMKYEIFAEEGSSEDWEGREQLQLMLQHIENKKIYDGILVTEQDRIARDSTDFGIFKRFCRKHGLVFYTLDKVYNFTDDSDDFMTGIQAEVDQHFMRILKRKMLRGRIQALESGVYFGIAPYGYDKAPTKPKVLIPNKEESEVVKQIFDWYVNKNMNQEEIVAQLHLMGYKPKRYNRFTTRSISVLLSNVAYIGTLHYELENHEPIIVENAHEAIISKEIFNKAQIIRAKRRNVPQSARKGKYILSQLLKCPKCGTTLSFCMKYTNKKSKEELGKEGREAYVLNCYSSLSNVKKREVTKRCDNYGIKASRVEEYVFLALEKHLDTLDEEIELLMKGDDTHLNEVSGQIKAYKQRLTQLENERKNVQQGFRAGIYEEEEAKSEIKKIKEDQLIIEEKLLSLKNRDTSSEIKRKEDAKKKILKLLSSNTNNVEETNMYLRQIIDKIYYYKDKPDTAHREVPFEIGIEFK